MPEIEYCRPGFVPEGPGEEAAEAVRETAGVELFPEDFPALCPNASMPLWALHPRVYLDVLSEGEAACPYCGTRYRVRAGVHIRDHEFGARNLHQHRGSHEGRRTTENQTTPAGGAGGGEAANLAADSLGNTTLEQMTRWIKRQWN
jgi:uncharacterized Zn-finger protein